MRNRRRVRRRLHSWRCAVPTGRAQQCGRCVKTRCRCAVHCHNCHLPEPRPNCSRRSLHGGPIGLSWGEEGQFNVAMPLIVIAKARRRAAPGGNGGDGDAWSWWFMQRDSVSMGRRQFLATAKRAGACEMSENRLLPVFTYFSLLSCINSHFLCAIDLNNQ